MVSPSGDVSCPMGMIDLSVTFGDVVHYRRETLPFKVVDCQGPYNAIFGRPCYAKFMALPNYAYLKLKMLGLHDVNTMSGNFQNTYHCERDAVEYAEANNLDSGGSHPPLLNAGEEAPIDESRIMAHLHP